jgi:hypothetical protein
MLAAALLAQVVAEPAERMEHKVLLGVMDSVVVAVERVSQMEMLAEAEL